MDLHRDTLDSLAVHVAVLDARGVIVATNAAWDRFAADNGGSEVDTGPGADYLAACEAGAPAVAAGLRAILAGERDALELEYPCHAPDEERWFVLRATPYRSGGPARVVVQHENVTERRLAADAAHRRAKLLDAVDAAVVATDLDGLVIEWSGGAERLYGWSRAEVVGRPIVDFPIVTHDPRTARRRDGTTFPVFSNTTALEDAAGRCAGVVGVSFDATERLAHERELAEARDYLRAVTDSMGEGVCTLDADGRLVYMNAAAEEMLGWRLAELAGRDMHEATHFRTEDGSPRPVEDCPLLGAWRDGEVVRVEDDVFVRRDGTLLPVAYTSSPIVTSDGITGSVFVFSDISERRAEQRRTEAKLESLTWIRRIKEALANDAFELHAQPIVEVATGRTVQHELLIRMRDADGTLIPPGRFLPVAEEYGLITEIDRWVIARAAALAGRGHPVELNVSARSLNDRRLADYVAKQVRDAGADPRLLVFELTETALLESDERAVAFIQRLEQLGSKVALDDFGTGYGGFTYLKRLPVDYLKIDIEFVRDLPRDEASRHVVAAVVNLARGFGQKTVAEGVEDEETLVYLRELGVDYAQGYGIGRPGPLSETIERTSARPGARLRQPPELAA